MRRRLPCLALVLLLSTSAFGAPRLGGSRVIADPPIEATAPTGAVCGRGEVRCGAHVAITPAGEIQALGAPAGFGPADLQAAYVIDPAIADSPTVAVVVAYGYANLEADLAVYRSTYGLPPCTVASGCLTVVNQDNATSPLPPEAPPDADWTIETALDIAMVSAGCPRCKILVVQAPAADASLYTAQLPALLRGAAVISNSWGRPQLFGEDLSAFEAYFHHPGVATFVASGDRGYNEGGAGPAYPATSRHVISVGGTTLVRDTSARGWSETAWANGGSACSLSIEKPASQPASPCRYRVASDLAAVGDPATGVAVYNARNGGWLTIGGTSGAAPFVAAIFAATGNGDVTPDTVAQLAGRLHDVTSGRNGTCGSIHCNATAGWDGPTGFGTPNADKLGAPRGLIALPYNGAIVPPGFAIDVDASSEAIAVEVYIDGVAIGVRSEAPYSFDAPSTLAQGVHEVAVIEHGRDGRSDEAIHVTVAGLARPTADDDDETITGGCSSGGSASPLIMLVLGLVTRRRRA